MSKFIIACPVCHRYVEAGTGLFARKYIRCSCGNIIDVRTDRMAMTSCPSCGNNVMYDQADGTDAICPVCKAQLITPASFSNLVHIRCAGCGCLLHAAKNAFTVTCPVCDTVCDVQREVKKAEMREAGVRAVISYEGDNSTFVYRHPMTDFISGSELIVHESQTAIFFRNGQALDQFESGRYTLDTGIMPKLNQFYRLPEDSKSFHAEVYFINMTTQMGIKWGTPSKAGLFDPATGLHVELGASGTFNLKVIHPRKLLIKLVGTTGTLSRSELFQAAERSGDGNVDAGYFRTMVATKVKSNLAKIIKENAFSVLELDEHLDEISAALRAAINGELADYGLELPEFYVANIVTPDDDPNFRRMKQQHADLYLRTREEQIKKAEAEAAFERLSVEAQTRARMEVINAQGAAEAARIAGQAQADVYRMQAEAEAQEMRLKGYTYQQETARQVATEAMRNGAAGGLAGAALQFGLGLDAAKGAADMVKDALKPEAPAAQPAADSWDCECGEKGITSKFCPECCKRRPEPPQTWDCPECGAKGITSRFCPECGHRRED